MHQPIIDQFEKLQQDAVLWKSSKVWSNAQSPDEQAMAMQQLVELLYCISNETKRTSYVKIICESVGQKVLSAKKEIERIAKIVDVKSKQLGKMKSKPERTSKDNIDTIGFEKEVALLNDELVALQANRTMPLLEKDLLKQLNEHSKKLKQKQEEVKRKADFERTIKSADDAGLPVEFEGTMDDVFAALKYGIYVHENVYYSRGGMKGDYPISNFTMRIIYHIPTNDETSFRLISVKNVYGFETVININTDDFVSIGSFKKILARRGDFIFKGADSDLCRLQEFLQKDETSAQRIEVLGWNKTQRFWAWSNGLSILNDDNTTTFVPIDNHGIVEFGSKRYFIPAMSMMYAMKEGLFVNEKKFLYSEPIQDFGFEQWAFFMYKAYGKKSIAAILFYIGSLYRDIMMKKIRRYPLLNLFGPPGAGKGEMYDSLMHMFGQKQDQVMLGGATTAVGLMRKFAQFCNALVGVDEYKNNLATKLIESLKNLYDGIGYERGKMTNDFTTESTPVNSSTILLGQDMPTVEPALFMRCILLAFEEGKFTEEQRENFANLKQNFEPHGLGFITSQLLCFRGLFEEQFKDKYNIIFKQTVKDVGNVEIDDRMLMNISILLTTMHLTEPYLKFPFSYNEAKKWLIANMETQHSILAGNNDLAKFWQVIEALFYRDEIHEERDFILRDGYIFIRIQQVHPLYIKEMIARRDMNYLAKPTLEHYLRLDKTVYADEPRQRFSDGSNSWTFKMKYSKLGIDLIKIKQSAGESTELFEKRIAEKNNEMGVSDELAELQKPLDDLPF